MMKFSCSPLMFDVVLPFPTLVHSSGGSVAFNVAYQATDHYIKENGFSII